jgi:hypothetical protein
MTKHDQFRLISQDSDENVALHKPKAFQLKSRHLIASHELRHAKAYVLVYNRETSSKPCIIDKSHIKTS